MNSLIEQINHCGESFLSFAWPMLWQSSLLIIVVFALEYLLARRVRAAIRHALWIVVLVKLLLPPAFALPTGAVWWLWPAKPSLTPLFKSERVTFDTTPLPENFVPESVPMPVPPPKLSGLGWAMLASGVVSAGLLFSLLVNWLKVARKTHRVRVCAEASGDFSDTLDQARQLAGLRGPMRLKLVDEAISPAVYGLFRPVILLPRALAEKLSAAQLRAVLLHEAVHLRRGDVWVNCAQTLLQIAYWWHPLFWLANARIRRLREEAVDDAVMLALRGDADAYAPTLLEVAKFAFRRPLASLGLVGILESRSALRQRVERLVDFQAPRKAGVTFLSLFGIFLFGAVTLPMGQAPAAMTVDSTPADHQWQASPPPSSHPLWQASAPLPQTIHVATTNTGPRFDVEHYRISGNSILTPQTISATLANIDGAFGTNVSYEGVKTVQEQLQQAYYERGYAAVKVTLPRQKITNATVTIQVREGRLSATTNDIIIDAPVPQASLAVDTNRIVMTSPGRRDIYRKLTHIRLDAVSYQALPLSEVIRMLAEESQRRDPNKTGINFVYNPNIPDTPVHIDPATGLPAKAATGPSSVDANQINISVNVKNVSLENLLDAICKAADHPIKYSVEEYGIVFSPYDPAAPQYEMRTFKVNPNFFYSQWKENLNSYLSNSAPPFTNSIRDLTDDAPGLSYAGPGQQAQGLDLDSVAKQFFQKQGINLAPPKTIFYNERLGVLFVYATPKELEVIESIVSELGDPRTPFKNVTRSSSKSDRKQAANAWEQVGKVFYEGGDLDEARRDLNEALDLDPDNQAARYYLNLVLAAKKHATQTQAPATNPPAAATFARDGELLYEMGRIDEAQLKLEEALSLDPDNQGAEYYLNLTIQAQQTRQEVAYAGQGQGPLWVKPVVYSGVPFVLKRPPSHSGIFDPQANHPSYQPVSASPNSSDLVTNYFDTLNIAVFKNAVRKETGEPDAILGFRELATRAGVDLSPPAQVSIPNERLDMLYVVATRKDMKSIQGILDGLDCAAKETDIITNYFYNLNMAAFKDAVRQETGQSDAILGFRELAAKVGVDFSPPKQFSFTNERFGGLYAGLHIVATRKDTGIILHILEGLHCIPPQIHIKARFIEVPKTFFDDERNSIPTAVTNGGILTDSQFRKFLHQLMSLKGPQELAEPEVTTIMGRQTQMRTTIIQPIITNWVVGVRSGEPILTYPQLTQVDKPASPPPPGTIYVSGETENVETGPILDALPMDLPDGYTIDLKTIPSIIKFYGYADTKDLPPQIETNSDGQKIEMPISIPVFSVGEVTDEARLYDGQTLVLLPKPKFDYNGPADEKYRDRIAKHIQEAQKKEESKQLIVLVTATLIDPAGNRTHSDTDMAFAQNRVPQQPIIWSSTVP